MTQNSCSHVVKGEVGKAHRISRSGCCEEVVGDLWPLPVGRGGKDRERGGGVADEC